MPVLPLISTMDQEAVRRLKDDVPVNSIEPLNDEPCGWWKVSDGSGSTAVALAWNGYIIINNSRTKAPEPAICRRECIAFNRLQSLNGSHNSPWPGYDTGFRGLVSHLYSQKLTCPSPSVSTMRSALS